MIKSTSIIYSIVGTEDSKYEVSLRVSESKEQAMYNIHKALAVQLNNRRQGTAHTKTKSDVKGGGRKPWKQKGSGRARAGSNRSPLWRGGGVIFGPQTKKYKYKINKKEKKLALSNLIYNKYGQTIVTNTNQLVDKPHTQTLLQKLNNLGINTYKEKILVIVNQKESKLYLSVRNVTNIELINSEQLNILSILKADRLIIDTQAIEKIHEIYK